MKDGSTAEVDVIMMCTGYLHSYPFLRSEFFVDEILILSCKVFIIMLMFLIPREELRMKCKNLFYPPGLYKVIKLTFSQDFKD